MRLLTLDEDAESRDALALAALEAAGRKPTPYGKAAKAAYQEYVSRIASGETHTASMEAARAALHSALGSGRR